MVETKSTTLDRSCSSSR